METKQSLILVTVDCLRADHVGFLGYNRPTTPFLDSLASQSFVIPAAVAAGSPTYYSFPATFASRTPLGLGRDVLGIAPGEPTLASVFRDNGFQTAAFSAANPYLSGRFGYDTGFETFQDFLASEPASNSEAGVDSLPASRINRALAAASHRLLLGSVYDEIYFQYCQRLATAAPKSMSQLRRFPSADVIIDAATAWLNSIEGSPFFLWLHLMDPHAPYYPTEQALAMMGTAAVKPFRARYLNSVWQRSDLSTMRLTRYRDDVIGLYDSGIRWMDSQLARLVDTLREFGQWENTLFAITADHGEEFLDHGGRFHPPVKLFEETVHIPFLLRVPGVPARTQTKSAFSVLNFAPTVLDALRIKIPSEFRGKSYWNELKQGQAWDEPAIVECIEGCTNPFWPEQRIGSRILAVRDARYKLILHFDPPRDYLFDLDADPLEVSPLPPASAKSIRRKFLDHARCHLLRERDQDARLRARIRDVRLECAKPVAQDKTNIFSR